MYFGPSISRYCCTRFSTALLQGTTAFCMISRTASTISCQETKVNVGFHNFLFFPNSSKIFLIFFTCTVTY